MPRRMPSGLLAAGLALALAACAAPPSSERQSWVGTSSADAATHPLTIDVTHAASGAWTGSYTVERTPAFTGAVDATLVSGVLEGVLVVSNACRFELTGTVSGGALAAAFTPTECPGGTAGTWSATRTTPATNPSGAPSDAATFDGGALFDAAVFH